MSECIYCFAYGSNMSERRMRERNIAYYERKAAHLNGYRLGFNKVAQCNARMGYANIVIDNTGLVEGALYSIEPRLLPKLDECEGYPLHYLKSAIKIVLPKTGEEVCAITYIAQPNKVREGLRPSREYLSYLLDAKDILSTEYFKKLSETRTLD